MSKRLRVPSVNERTAVTNISQDEMFLYERLFSAVSLQQTGGLITSSMDDIVARELGFTAPMSNGPTVNINERFSKRHPVADLNIPREPVAVIQTALRYCYDNPFVAKALRVKTDFVVKNFEHRTENESVKGFFDKECLRLDIFTRTREITWLAFGVGVVPVYWGGEETGRIDFVEILDPRQCKLQRVMGRYKCYLKIDQSMIDAVRDPQGKANMENKARFQSMPKYWIRAIEGHIEKGFAGQSYIELKDDSYTVVQNRYSPINRISNSLDGIPLQPAFDALQRYRLLAAGDFGVAWGVKNMITLISEGDPKVDVKSYVPADNTRLAALQAKFQQPDYQLTVYCDPTTEVRYVVPPIEVFDPKKYAQVEKEVKEVLNLPGFMWLDSNSGSYSASSAELKLLREEVDAMRMTLRTQFFMPLYSRLRAAASKPGFAEKAIVLPSFDNNSLRDDQVWLPALADLYGRGGMSLKSLAETYGLDFEYEMKELEREHKDLKSNRADRVNPTIAQPLHEPNQGNQDPTRNKGGNDGSPRRPRPSGK